MVEIPRCNCGSRDSGLVCFRGRWWCVRCIESALDASENMDAELRAQLKTAYYCLGPDYAGEWDLGYEKRRPLDSLISEVESDRAELLKTVALLKHRLTSATCPVPSLAEYEQLRHEVARLVAENEQLKATLSEGQIAVIEAAEAAEEED